MASTRDGRSKERSSPIGPGREAIGAPGYYPQGARYPSAEPSPNTMLVGKGHSRDPSADPSVGTAVERPAAIERNGAAYKVRTIFSPYAPVAHPSAVHTEEPHGASNTPWVPDGQAPSGVDGSVTHGAGTNATVQEHVARSRGDGTLPYLGG